MWHQSQAVSSRDSSSDQQRSEEKHSCCSLSYVHNLCCSCGVVFFFFHLFMSLSFNPPNDQIHPVSPLTQTLIKGISLFWRWGNFAAVKPNRSVGPCLFGWCDLRWKTDSLDFLFFSFHFTFCNERQLSRLAFIQEIHIIIECLSFQSSGLYLYIRKSIFVHNEKIKITFFFPHTVS